MDKIELANMVNGALGRRTTQDSANTVGRTRTYSGIATSDSNNGKVYVALDGDSVTQDDSQSVLMDTVLSVRKGQKVIVTVVNGTPTVTGNIGWGDGMVQALNDFDDDLNQQGIFNRLTNNGQEQGIYMEDGKIYINSKYINTEYLIAPKVGNSPTGYASIGDVEYQSIDMTGINFTNTGGINRLFFGRTEDSDPTNQAIIAYGLPGEWGMTPLYLGLDNQGYIFGLPTLTEVNPGLQSYLAPYIHMNKNFLEFRGYRSKQVFAVSSSGFMVRDGESGKTKLSLDDDGLYAWSYTNNATFFSATPSGGRIADGGGTAGAGTTAHTLVKWDTTGLHAYSASSYSNYNKLTLSIPSSKAKIYIARNYMGNAVMWCEGYTLPNGSANTTVFSIQLQSDYAEYFPLGNTTSCTLSQQIMLPAGEGVVISISNTGLIKLERMTATSAKNGLKFTMTYPIM